MSMKIPFVTFQPLERELDKELRDAFERVLSRSWYIEGAEDKEFERAFAEYIGTEYCIGCGNGLDALMLSLKALEIGEGDEVIVPSNTYIATALAVTYVGAKPVFVEPDIRTFNINPDLIEEAITDKTKAIMPVHLYGQACNMDLIVDIAKNHGLYIIEDTDEGARYIGEFSFGLNPYVTFPMKDILFDEKISGSLHFTPGCAYEDADNTNRSAVHWDLVLIQTPEYGGGEIYLDDELIRKDGRFVVEDLLCLNPENLK